MEADISIWQKPGHFYFALTRRQGSGYKAGKSDTPPQHRRRRVAISISVQVGAGKFRRSARALPVAVGEGDFDQRWRRADAASSRALSNRRQNMSRARKLVRIILRQHA
jgi:hypothetical protein